MQSYNSSAMSSMTQSCEEISQAVEHRRNFATISHPDAGKTTLTEKLLLYGGAIQEAGAVKAKRASYLKSVVCAVCRSLPSLRN